jgi:hypothetical protein
MSGAHPGGLSPLASNEPAKAVTGMGARGKGQVASCPQSSETGPTRCEREIFEFEGFKGHPIGLKTQRFAPHLLRPNGCA